MKSLKEKIEVMQAALDGKDTELNSGDGWRPSFIPKNHAWDWANYDYRIKQEPMEIYAEVYENGKIVPYEKINLSAATDKHRTIKFREVKDES